MNDRRTLGISSLLVMLLVLAGCPYDSAVALDDAPKIAIDAKLLGDWSPAEPDKEQGARMTVARWNDKEYAIAFSAADDNTTLARAYLSEVGGKRLLNVQEIGVSADAKGTFMIYSYEITSQGRLVARAVSDDFVKEKFETSKALRAYLEKHLAEKALFEDAGAFTRVEKPPPGK